jgi:thioredoxin 1
LPAPAMDPVVVTDANFSQVVEKSPVPVLLDLWAAWCGPCRMIAPTIEMLARELAGKALVGKLDVDANQRTAAKFGVQGIPTLLILKEGREVDRLRSAVAGGDPGASQPTHLRRDWDAFVTSWDAPRRGGHTAHHPSSDIR